jgi:glycerol-3-phosphate acyltransferase PlsY
MNTAEPHGAIDLPDEPAEESEIPFEGEEEQAMLALSAAVCVTVGYLCGSFLTADVVMRARTGRSAFAVGSGNPGMANVGAQLGPRWAAVVLAGDILKTIAAVALAAGACTLLGIAAASLNTGAGQLLAPLVSWPWSAGFPHSGTASTLLAGLGAVLGHDFPFWHRFRGGKGVTATCSAIILFSPLLGGVASVIGLVVVAFSRKLDIGALVIPAAFFAGVVILGFPLSASAVAAFLLAVSIGVWVRGRSAAPRRG